MRFYLGSTYSDLKEHREAAIAAFRDWSKSSSERYVDYEFFDPEALSPTSASYLHDCLREVKESHYFLLIVGWRYGYISEGSDKSIVELEYEAALEARLTRFCFLIDDSYPVPPKYVEAGEGADKLKRFRFAYKRTASPCVFRRLRTWLES